MPDPTSFFFTVPDFGEIFGWDDDEEIYVDDKVTIIPPEKNIWRVLPFCIDTAKDIEEC